MNRISLFIGMLLLFGTCNEEDSYIQTLDGTSPHGQGGGDQVLFLTYQNYGVITVFVNGIHRGTISTYVTSGSVPCGRVGCVTVSANAGEEIEWFAYSDYRAWGTSDQPNKYTPKSTGCNRLVLP